MSVCVCPSLFCVSVCGLFCMLLSPVVRTAIRQRGQFILGVKKARLSINQSSTNFNTSHKAQPLEKEIKMIKFTKNKGAIHFLTKKMAYHVVISGGQKKSRITLLLAQVNYSPDD